ncbi:MAG: tRNA-intron lyase, partial [Candidatus Diapherotrites archaeon]
EAVYLLEKENIEIEDKKGKKIGEKEVHKVALKEKKFSQKYAVFKDLKERGFCVKTGFKFGFDFRVYPRGKKPGEAHSQWVVSVHSQSEKFSLPELSRMIRLAGNLKTKLLMAVVDAEHQVSFYEAGRITP